MRIEEDGIGICEYCKREWTEPDDKYNDGCCFQDIEDNTQPREER